jgi:hypothetical protein
MTQNARGGVSGATYFRYPFGGFLLRLSESEGVWDLEN